MILLIYDWRFPFYLGAAIGIVAAIVFFVITRKNPLKEIKKKLIVGGVFKNFEF